MSQAPATPSRTPSAGDPRTREFRGSISLRVLELTEPSGRGPGRARSSPHAGAASPTSQGPLCGASLALAPRTELSGQPLQTPPDPGPLRLVSYPELSTGGRLAGAYGAPDAGFCGGHLETPCEEAGREATSDPVSSAGPGSGSPAVVRQNGHEDAHSANTHNGRCPSSPFAVINVLGAPTPGLLHECRQPPHHADTQGHRERVPAPPQVQGAGTTRRSQRRAVHQTAQAEAASWPWATVTVLLGPRTLL